MLEPNWRRPSTCESSGCVEVALDVPYVVVRDGNHVMGPVLKFTPGEWREFVDAVRRGEFDLQD